MSLSTAGGAAQMPLMYAGQSLLREGRVEWLTALVAACVPSFAALHGFQPVEKIVASLGFVRATNFLGCDHYATEALFLASWSCDRMPAAGGVRCPVEITLFVTQAGKLMMLSQFETEGHDRRWELTFPDATQLERGLPEDIPRKIYDALIEILRSARAHNEKGLTACDRIESVLAQCTNLNLL